MSSASNSPLKVSTEQQQKQQPEPTETNNKRNNDGNNRNSNEMNAMINTLQNSLEGVQNSFCNAYSTLVTNLKQSFDMMKAMNSVLEQFLLANIHISTKIQQVNKSAKFIPSLLTINLENKGQFPIPNITCILIFEKKDLEKQVIFEIECIESVSQEIMKPNSTLVTNLKQSFDMMKAMNSVLEQFLLANIHISTKIQQVNKSAKFIPSLLTINLENKGQFPIPNITCILIFEKKDLEKQVIFEIECIESVSQEIMKPNSVSKRSHSIFANLINSHEESFTLNPQTQIIEKILLAPSELHQYNVKVLVNFPSPGTGKTLQTEHMFGLYLIDQCEKRLHAGPKLFDEPLSFITVDLSPFILRKLWNVHPSIGLHDGLIFELIWTDKFWMFICIKEWIGDNCSMVSCKVSSITLMGSEIVLKILEELKVLGNLNNNNNPRPLCGPNNNNI
ncbi:hypothetical protein Glove_172g35 [Diversispora epigaea]|uniref:Uncharacterized protein n=1 Tax=Diversispora epigaea TaxID=1348612 RepID=A0A397IP86_9GLOM|nr:hypothetical protein Glove_172g35 [Diversispora epigaea]